MKTLTPPLALAVPQLAVQPPSTTICRPGAVNRQVRAEREGAATLSVIGPTPVLVQFSPTWKTTVLRLLVAVVIAARREPGRR